MLHWVSICNYIFFFIVVEHTTAYVNHSLGFQFCSTHGGMYSYNTFKYNNGFAYIKDVLKGSEQLLEGESAWIDGIVEYTTFVSFESCYQARRSATAVEIHLTKDINLYHCINACRNEYKLPKPLYIGLKSERCLCLDDMAGFTRIRTDNYKCDQFQPYNLKFISTTSDQFPVFNVIVTGNFQWDPPSTGSKQCVKAKKTGNQEMYATDSCYQAYADGFLCSQIHFKNVSNSFCIVDSGECIFTDSTSWLQAKEKCMNYTGSLDRHIFQHHHNLLNSTNEYWVGMFRSFDIVSNSYGRAHSTACLAATRVGDKLMLDPDDCNEQKRIICADGLYGDIDQDENIDTTHFFTPQPNSNFTTLRNSSESGQYVPIFVSIGVTLIAIVIIVFYFVCKKRSRESTKQRLSSSNIASIGHKANGNDIDVSDTAEQMLNGSEKTEKGPKPSKPSRRTIRQSPKHSNYENVKMSYGKLTKMVEQCNDNQDYDRVNLKGIKVNVSKQTQSETCEATIYDHTFQTDEQENYDTCTLKSSKSLHKSTDTTYNKVGERLERDDESTVRTITDSDQKLTDYSAVVLQETCNKSE